MATNHVFLSYTSRHHEAAHQFIQAMLEKEFVESRWGMANTTGVTEDQTILAAAFKEVVNAWPERKRWSKVDPAQMLWAFLVAAWRCVQNLDDKEWDALTNVANDEVATLSLLCNPYEAVLEDNEDPPVDH